MTDPSLYSFSDEFLNILSQAQEAPQQQSEDFPDFLTQEEEPQPEEENDLQSQYDDLNNRYEEQLTLNQQLQDQISNNQPSYQESDYLEDEPNFMMDFIYKNVITNPVEFSATNKYSLSNLNDFRTKDASVNVSNIDERLQGYLENLPPDLQEKILVTSGNDFGGHVKGSKHYQGQALDLRYDPDLYNYIAADSTKDKYSLKTLDPNHGTAKHIHLQVK